MPTKEMMPLFNNWCFYSTVPYRTYFLSKCLRRLLH